VLLDYLNECNDEDRNEIITAFLPYIPSLASTKDGVRSSMICFWNSIVKDRRVSNRKVSHCTQRYSIYYYLCIGHCEKSQGTLDKVMRSRAWTCIDLGNN